MLVRKLPDLPTLHIRLRRAVAKRSRVRHSRRALRLAQQILRLPQSGAAVARRLVPEANTETVRAVQSLLVKEAAEVYVIILLATELRRGYFGERVDPTPDLLDYMGEEESTIIAINYEVRAGPAE